MAQRGLSVEINFSKQFHLKGVPLLVSPLVLRSRGMGQVDLARIGKEYAEWIVEIAEVKTSLVGQHCLMRSQKSRLLASQRFLTGIFGHKSRLIHLLGSEVVS